MAPARRRVVGGMSVRERVEKYILLVLFSHLFIGTKGLKNLVPLLASLFGCQGTKKRPKERN
jgi:hypothetical protein